MCSHLSGSEAGWVSICLTRSCILLPLEPAGTFRAQASLRGADLKGLMFLVWLANVTLVRLFQNLKVRIFDLFFFYYDIGMMSSNVASKQKSWATWEVRGFHFSESSIESNCYLFFLISSRQNFLWSLPFVIFGCLFSSSLFPYESKLLSSHPYLALLSWDGDTTKEYGKHVSPAACYSRVLKWQRMRRRRAEFPLTHSPETNVFH